MKAISISLLRKNISSYFRQVRESSEVIIVPGVKEEEAIVIMSLSEYNSYKETEYLLATETNREALAESIEQYEKGETVSVKLSDLK